MKKYIPYSYLGILLYSIFFTAIVSYINAHSLIGIDDANIYMVYMKNFAQGHGFVYNVGGEKVEGFTSLLWTLIGAFFFWISNRPELLLLVFSLLVVSYALWKICLSINLIYGNKHFFSLEVILFLGLLIALPGYFEWTVLALMDTGLWGSLLILLALHVLNFNSSPYSKANKGYFSILIFLLCLCRPESMVWGPFFLLAEAYRLYEPSKNRKQNMERLAPMFVVFLATQVLLLLWRKSYFGYPFPNTFYAKVSSDLVANAKAGLVYLLDYFHQAPFHLLIFFFAIIVAMKFLFQIVKTHGSDQKLNTNAFRSFVLLGIIFISLLLPIYAGGDHFTYFRIMQPTVPLAFLAFIFTLQFFQFKMDVLWLPFILVFALFTSGDNLFHTFRKRNSPFQAPLMWGLEGRRKSELLNEFFKVLPKYPSQGVFAAGGRAFSYRGVTIDLLGLNNVKMAHADKIKDRNLPKNHASFNKGVFYEQKPDIISYQEDFIPISDTLNYVFAKRDPIKFAKNINYEKKFKEEYSDCLIIRKGFPQALHIVASNDFLNSLDSSLFRVIKGQD
jgi:arabinofuranosyltransferase